MARSSNGTRMHKTLGNRHSREIVSHPIRQAGLIHRTIRKQVVLYHPHHPVHHLETSPVLDNPIKLHQQAIGLIGIPPTTCPLRNTSIMVRRATATTITSPIISNRRIQPTTTINRPLTNLLIPRKMACPMATVNPTMLNRITHSLVLGSPTPLRNPTLASQYKQAVTIRLVQLGCGNNLDLGAR